jgi:ABC-type dipeptide/oligopeptide/nickel transport system ATPase subunit
MIYVPGVDIDIPAEAVGMPLQETQPKSQPRPNSPEFESADLRLKPENKAKALNHLSAIRDRLSQPKDSQNASADQAKQAIQRKRRLLDSLGLETEQARKRAHEKLFGVVAEYPIVSEKVA